MMIFVLLDFMRVDIDIHFIGVLVSSILEFFFLMIAAVELTSIADCTPFSTLADCCERTVPMQISTTSCQSSVHVIMRVIVEVEWASRYDCGEPVLIASIHALGHANSSTSKTGIGQQRVLKYWYWNTIQRENVPGFSIQIQCEVVEPM